MVGRPFGSRSVVSSPEGLWYRKSRAGAGALTGTPSTVTPWSEASKVAGVSTGLPPIATRPSAIIRSISRREAMPARASNLAMRWPSRGLSSGRRGAGRAVLLTGTAQGPFFCARPTGAGGSAAPSRSLRRHNRPKGASRAYMLFGKRERAIRRILIVEDEPLVAFDNEHLLTESGYEVAATVDTLAEAVRALAEQDAIDLVLCDVGLSGDGDGTDVARAAAAKGVPVLFVTAHCPIEARSLAVGCLAKPFTGKMLKNALAAVDRALRGEDVRRLPAGLSLYALAAPQEAGPGAGGGGAAIG